MSRKLVTSFSFVYIFVFIVVMFCHFSPSKRNVAAIAAAAVVVVVFLHTCCVACGESNNCIRMCWYTFYVRRNHKLQHQTIKEPQKTALGYEFPTFQTKQKIQLVSYFYSVKTCYSFLPLQTLIFLFLHIATFSYDALLNPTFLLRRNDAQLSSYLDHPL